MCCVIKKHLLLSQGSAGMTKSFDGDKKLSKNWFHVIPTSGSCCLLDQQRSSQCMQQRSDSFVLNQHNKEKFYIAIYKMLTARKSCHKIKF